MNTEPNRAVVERATALTLYQFGEAVVRFRYVAEREYVGAGSLLDTGDDRPPLFPDLVDTVLGLIVEHATLLTSGTSAETNVLVRAGAMTTSAQVMRDRLEAAWMDADHQARLRRYQDESDRNDGRYEALLRMHVLQGFGGDGPLSSESPLAPSAWSEYQAAADGLAESFSPLCRSLFDLSRLLSTVVYPRPSDYADARGCLRALDPVHVQGQVSPAVTRLMRVIRSESDLLAGLPERLTGTVPDEAAGRLHKKVLSGLRRGGPRTAIAPGNPVNNEATTPLPSSPPAIPAEATLSVTPLHPDEDVAALLKLKSEMDPKDTYIGQSLPVLRLFRQVELLNRLPDDPIVILGPSGSGKTRLARIIHDTSARSKGLFLDLSADDLIDGDATIRRVKWAGEGCEPPGTSGRAPPLAREPRRPSSATPEECTFNLTTRDLHFAGQIPIQTDRPICHAILWPFHASAARTNSRTPRKARSRSLRATR